MDLLKLIFQTIPGVICWWVFLCPCPLKHLTGNWDVEGGGKVAFLFQCGYYWNHTEFVVLRTRPKSFSWWKGNNKMCSLKGRVAVVSYAYWTPQRPNFGKVGFIVVFCKILDLSKLNKCIAHPQYILLYLVLRREKGKRFSPCPQWAHHLSMSHG